MKVVPARFLEAGEVKSRLFDLSRPLVTLLLNSALNLIESALQAEGPAVLQDLEAELAKLKAKYPAVAPTSKS